MLLPYWLVVLPTQTLETFHFPLMSSLTSLMLRIIYLLNIVVKFKGAITLVVTFS